MYLSDYISERDFIPFVDEIPWDKLINYTGILDVGNIEWDSNKLNDIVHSVSLEDLQKLLPAVCKEGNSEKTMVYAHTVQPDGERGLVTFLIFITPAGNAFILSLPNVKDKSAKLSAKANQIVRMYQFKLKHLEQFKKLSDREIEVLKLLANGYNNPQIAEKLFLSRYTVETHRKNIKRKLKLESFLDLMRYAFAFDLVDVHS